MPLLLKDEELAEKGSKGREREWVRRERRYGNSLWHAGYAQLPDGRWFMACMDDASRFITGYGVFDDADGPNAIRVLHEAAARHGAPASVLTGRGAQFYGAEKRGATEFEQELVRMGIRHVLAGRAQTGGKLGRFCRELKRHLPSFEEESAMSGTGRGGGFGGPFHTRGPRDPVDRLVDWYNNERFHDSLDADSGETPAGAFARKAAPRGADAERESRQRAGLGTDL